MSLARIIAYSVYKMEEAGISPFKTMVHKLIYLALSDSRDDLYRPYFYGPYSDQVQYTIQSLLKNDIIRPNPKEFHLNLRSLESQGLDPDSMLENSSEQRRVEAAVQFVKEKGLDSVDSISNLSKVHYLSVRIGYKKEDLIQSVKHRAKYLGWSGIAGMTDKKVKELHALGELLEERLRKAG